MPQLARDLVRSAPLTVAADTPLLEVQHLLVLAQVSGMPVVETDGRVMGVLSASDVLRAFDQAFDGDRDEGEAGAADDDIELPDLIRTLTARDLATPDAVWVGPDVPAAKIAEVMRSEGVHRVLVGDGTRLDGVLTAFDLLVAVA